jgi:hypothetical protein
MTKKTRVLGAAFAALAFSLLFVAAAFAAQPTYSISLAKTADPATLPAGGGDVEFTVWLENTGTGDLQVVSVWDDDCTLSGDGSEFGPANKFESGAKVSYTCTVEDITDTFTNHAHAVACQNSGNPCNSDAHDAAADAAATVTVGTTTATIDTTGTSAAVLALVLLAIGGLGFLGTTNRLPKLPKFR